jgi:hypothetical protein
MSLHALTRRYADAGRRACWGAAALGTLAGLTPFFTPRLARAASGAAAAALASPAPIDFEDARRGIRFSLSARMGWFGAELSPLVRAPIIGLHVRAPIIGLHGMNLSLELPVSKRLRIGTEVELVGLANDLVVEHAGTLNGAAISGTLAGIATQGSLVVLQLRRFDLEAQLLAGIDTGGTGDANFKVVQTAPSLPDDDYDAGATVRFAGRLTGYYWLFGFGSQGQAGAVALFASLGLDAHALWVSASPQHPEPAAGLYSELAVQLGIALSGEP